MKKKSIVFIFGLLLYGVHSNEAELQSYSSIKFVKDLLASQQSFLHSTSGTGNLQGTVGMQGVLVSCGLATCISTVGGYYSITVPEGFYYVEAYKPPYCHAPVGVYIYGGETLTLNMGMAQC